METYCLETTDGLLHLFMILDRQNDELECEAIHSDGVHTIRFHQTINACLFELFLKIGIIKQLDSVANL
ncbi:MAG: hypothetical protein N2442_13500 [Spirochaetes bacterium]|nr:hypothetical protein [Spirochaetota bacterium]